MRKNLDVSAYLVIGPENTCGRPVKDIVKAAVSQGFTTVQLRAKTSSAREILKLAKECADVIQEQGKSDKVMLLIDDRPDIAYAAIEQGIKVDGVHVGQSDIPVDICRKLLGNNAIIGTSPPRSDLTTYLQKLNPKLVDYLGVGPLHSTKTKLDAGLLSDGRKILRTLDEITEISKKSPVPVIVGGGVKIDDLKQIKATGASGFFVVSAIASANNPVEAAKNMVQRWNEL